jgi:uncharacterized membrane protein YidH (DUF202 family)
LKLTFTFANPSSSSSSSYITRLSSVARSFGRSIGQHTPLVAAPPPSSSCLHNRSSKPLPVRHIHVHTHHQCLLTHPTGKRIALPTRVEPKVFFANERTFLSWLNFTVILGGLAVGLLNFGDKIGKISAGLFTFVAMAAMAYALFTFHWRARSIRMRGQGGFDDRLGPTVLTIALFCAVVVNFVLRLTVDSGK